MGAAGFSAGEKKEKKKRTRKNFYFPLVSYRQSKQSKKLTNRNYKKKWGKKNPRN